MTTSTLIDPLPSLEAMLGHLSVSDVMSSDVRVARPSTTVTELIELLVDNHISGVPVVSDQGHPVGVVSATDVLRLASLEAGNGQSSYGTAASFGGDIDGGRGSFFMESGPSARLPDGLTPGLADWTVADIMTPATFSVGPDATLPQLAQFLMRGQIHRALVTRGTDLLGIVTAFDIVRAVAAAAET